MGILSGMLVVLAAKLLTGKKISLTHYSIKKNQPTEQSQQSSAQQQTPTDLPQSPAQHKKFVQWGLQLWHWACAPFRWLHAQLMGLFHKK